MHRKRQTILPWCLLMLKELKSKSIFDNPEINENNAILDELNSFADAINADRVPVVSLTQGTEALRVAMKIIENFKSL